MITLGGEPSPSRVVRHHWDADVGSIDKLGTDLQHGWLLKRRWGMHAHGGDPSRETQAETAPINGSVYCPFRSSWMMYRSVSLSSPSGRLGISS